MCPDAAAERKVTEDIRIHLLGTMNIPSRFYGHVALDRLTSPSFGPASNGPTKSPLDEWDT